MTNSLLLLSKSSLITEIDAFLTQFVAKVTHSRRRCTIYKRNKNKHSWALPSQLRDSLTWVRCLQPIASSDASTPNRLEMTTGDPETLLVTQASGRIESRRYSTVSQKQPDHKSSLMKLNTRCFNTIRGNKQ